MKDIKIVYNYDQDGYWLGYYELNESDKDPFDGSWLIPGQATIKEPLPIKEGYRIRFANNDWEYEKILTTEEKKVKGLLPLEEGEKIENETLVKLESPCNLYSWDYNLKEWYLDEEKVRISKLPSEKETLNAKIEMKAIELLTELELI